MGVSFRPEEVARFAAEQNLQLLAMDGFDTQYLWMTARKRETDSAPTPEPCVTAARIVQVTNTMTGDAVVPHSGCHASASLWVIGLDDRADLNSLAVDVDGKMTAPCFIGKHVWTGPAQLNFYLPPGSTFRNCPAKPQAWRRGCVEQSADARDQPGTHGA